MQAIWSEGGSVYFAALMERLNGIGRSWKPNTVLTFLTRLVEKGFLSANKSGRINQYVSLCTEDQYMESLTHSFLKDVYGGDAKGLVAALLRQDCLSEDDMAELQAFWRESKNE